MAPSDAFAEGAECYRNRQERMVMDMATPQEFDALIQRGLETSAEAMRLVLLSIQAGYNIRAMEQAGKQTTEKQAS